METDPKTNRPIYKVEEEETKRLEVEGIERGHEYEQALASPSGKVLIENALTELEKAIEVVLNVDTANPNLSVNYFTTMIARCQVYLGILRRFGFEIGRGRLMADRQIQKALRQK